MDQVVDLNPQIEAQFQETYDEMMAKGDLLGKTRLNQYYQRFQARFGKSWLESTDGETLLNDMHETGNRDSLVYWLEFKDDEEFPTRSFGSVAGGSALKYRVYRRNETGEWAIGDGNRPKEIEVEDAIEIARSHRDQLLRGIALLEALPSDATQDDYEQLQQAMSEQVEIHYLGWVHKYFSLLFPDKLDDYHNDDYSRFHLIRLLILPPESQGKHDGYIYANHFIDLCRHFDIPANHLTSVLNKMHGDPYAYWRVGTRGDKNTGESQWDFMREHGVAAIGWTDIGDLRRHSVESGQELREIIKQDLLDRGDHPSTAGRKSHEIKRFVNLTDYDGYMSVGDIVLAMEGLTVLGVGRVNEVGYRYVEGAEFAHTRGVDWLSTETWTLPEREGLRTTVKQLKKSAANLVEIERHKLMDERPDLPVRPVTEFQPDVTELPPIDEQISRQIYDILQRKKQVILYGPPGTGKTYWARRTANEIATRHHFGKTMEQLYQQDDSRVAKLGDYVWICTFHPAYGYEDFLEGYRPVTSDDGDMSFELKDGIFKRICDVATNDPEQVYLLLIDEINRGDIPRIFGELITLLEKDKRGMTLSLPNSGETFSVPDNVYIIGTMNTADRSIALLDAALRRRFGFYEMMPDSSVLKDKQVGSIPLGKWLRELNRRIIQHMGVDARNLQVGHAYLLEDGQPIRNFSRFARVLREDIIPLLEEYSYEDYGLLENLLGEGLVDVGNQRIRDEMFEPEQHDELISILITPEIATSTAALSVDAQDEDDEDDSAYPEDDSE